MNLLNFGMKHKMSRNIVLRFAAKICINLAKKNAEKEEQRLKKLHIREIDDNAAREMLSKMKKG